ncbi:MAG: hypothetical protein ABR523_00895, partial [Desulfurivibrionaceae bacterium]
KRQPGLGASTVQLLGNCRKVICTLGAIREIIEGNKFTLGATHLNHLGRTGCCFIDYFLSITRSVIQRIVKIKCG